MNCSIGNDYIIRYFDKTLSESENSALEAHLLTCRKCRNEFEFMHEAFDMLKKGLYVEPPTGIESRVMEKITTHINTKRKFSALISTVLFSAAALISLALVLFYVIDSDIMVHAANILKNMQDPAYITDTFLKITSVFEKIIAVAVNALNVIYDLNQLITEEYFPLFVACATVILLLHRVFIVERYQEGSRNS